MSFDPDFDLHVWSEANHALLANVVDGVLIAVQPQVYNWHLTLSSDPTGWFDDY